MVKAEARAWHVKNFNDRSIGIEMEDYDRTTKKNCLTDPNWCTEVELKTVVSLVVSLMKKYSIPLANVIGHNDPMLRKVYHNTHSDPGLWSWEKFIALVNKELENDGDHPSRED